MFNRKKINKLLFFSIITVILITIPVLSLLNLQMQTFINVNNERNGTKTHLKASPPTLVWSDEFDYDGLPDPTKWTYEDWEPYTVNNELQKYTRERLENTRVEDGHLTIEARRDFWNGYEYTSGRLITQYKGDWKYGRMEARIMLPIGVGTWPAFWMMPRDSVYGGWPDSGEIDILEHVGYDPGMIHGTIHCDAYNHLAGTQVGGSIYVGDCQTNYHVYALEWTADRMDWYIDDNLYFSFLNEGTGWTTWPFNQEFYIILNLAIGGDWGGQQGVDNEMFPTAMFVDYVRVYNLDDIPDVVPPTTPTGLQSTSVLSTSIVLTWNPSSDNIGVTGYNIYQNGVEIGTSYTNSYTVSNLSFETTYSYTIRAFDAMGNLSPESNILSVTTLSEIEGTNIALNKPITVSSIESTSYEGSNAVDGSLTTRWSSEFSDPQWIYIDLQNTYNINRVILNWETAYGSVYEIQVSSDTSTWTTVYSTTSSDGGIDDISFSEVNTRYVRMYAIQRSSEYGYSLFEFEVYGVIATGNNGDVNNDGLVDIIDALLIAQYYVELDPQPFYTDVADVNHDGFINIVDALLVAQYYVGLIDDL